ncbi:MAG: DUF2118 domain-containing protein [Sulfolobales archaeon]
MSLTSRVNEYLEKISKYYEGTSCYVRSEIDLDKCDESLPKELCKQFKRVECVSIVKFIDGVLLKNELLIRNDKIGKLINISNNAEVCVSEVSGREVILNVDEALKIGPNDLIAYVITGKSEVRNSYSGCKGYIILIEELIGRPQKYKIYVVGEEYVREIRQ